MLGLGTVRRSGFTVLVVDKWWVDGWVLASIGKEE